MSVTSKVKSGILLLAFFPILAMIAAWQQQNFPGGSASGSFTNGVFNISTSCSATSNCLQWVDDDSTDNCGAATTAFMALINAYAGPGGVQVFIGGSGPGKAYLLQTCQLIFTGAHAIITVINCNGTLDAGTNSSANLVQFSQGSNGGVYRWTGCTFTGGANLTVAGIEVTNSTGNAEIQYVNWLNFGAGNATLGTCTNWAVQFDNWIYEATIAHNEWTVTDSTTGRCAFNNVGTQSEESTVFFDHNVVGGKSGSFCGGVGIQDGGYFGTISANNIGNLAADIQIYGGGHRIIGNQLDNEGCVITGSNAVILYGLKGSTAWTVDGVTVSDNVAQFRGGGPQNFIQKAGNNSGASVISNWSILGNTQQNGSGSNYVTAALIAGPVSCGTSTFAGNTPLCSIYGNSNILPPSLCPSGYSGAAPGWQIGDKVAGCASSTAGAVVGSTALWIAPSAGGTPIYVNCEIMELTQATTSSTMPQCNITYTEGFTGTSSTQTLILTPVFASSIQGCSGTFAANPAVGVSCQVSSGRYT